MNKWKRRGIVLLAVVHLLTPPVSTAMEIGTFEDGKTPRTALRVKTFLVLARRWVSALKGMALEDAQSVLIHDRKRTNEWIVRPELELELEARQEQIRSNRSLVDFVDEARLKALRQGLRRMAEVRVTDRGEPSERRLIVARDAFLDELSRVTETLDRALADHRLTTISETAVPSEISDGEGTAWKLVLPESLHAEAAADDSERGKRLRSVAAWFLPKLVAYVDAYETHREEAREQSTRDMIAATWSGSSFDVNVKLEAMARYLMANGSSEGAIRELATRLDERYRRDKLHRRGYVGLCVAGAVILVAVTVATGGLAIWMTASMGLLAAIHEAGAIYFLVVLTAASYGSLTATCGVAMVHEAWSSTRRPPLEVIDFELRDRVAEALHMGRDARGGGAQAFDEEAAALGETGRSDEGLSEMMDDLTRR